LIDYTRHTLSNGLILLINIDHNTPLVAVNLLYNVGSKDESVDKTGFAHLFEHLMFGGSENIPDFDTPLQNAGGENNAFTNSDITNFYDTVPIENIETVLWLESDRMKQLAFNKKSLSIQKKVVVEEFKETCLNQPYGDAWHLLSDMVYKVHPYRWPTIGLMPEHIEKARLDDVKSFFSRFYCPSNAILAISGPIEVDQTIELVEKWFGDIPAGNKNNRNLPVELPQQAYQKKIHYASVPADNMYMAFKMPGRMDPAFYAIDLLSDIMGDGQSSRLYEHLLKDLKKFAYIDAYITGSIEPGMFVIEGKPADGVSIDEAEELIWAEIEELKKVLIPTDELLKLKHILETSNAFSETSALNKAINLSYYELLGEPDLINTEFDYYNAVTPEDIRKAANDILRKENCSVLVYKHKKEQEIATES
jgi:zinc protease